MQEANFPASHDSVNLKDDRIQDRDRSDVSPASPAVTSLGQLEQSLTDSGMANPSHAVERESSTEIGEAGMSLLVEGEAGTLSLASQELALAASALSPLSLAEVANLVSLIQELQHQNASLQNQVTQLETNLSERHTDWQSQVAQVQTQATQLQQQNQEAAIVQDRLNCLVRELECSHQVSQRQQILIETVTEQLENSQERCAQLERECALTQQRHHEQSQLVQQTETTCRDLRSRLYRQQRYTLQFKAALEKCLEMPAPHYTPTPDPTYLSVATQFQPFSGMAVPQVFLPKVQSIQPWSTQPWLLKEEDSAPHAVVAAGSQWSPEPRDAEVAPVLTIATAFSTPTPAEEMSAIGSTSQPISFNLRPPLSEFASEFFPTATSNVLPDIFPGETTNIPRSESEPLPPAVTEELNAVVDALRGLPPTVIEACVLQAMPDLVEFDGSVAKTDEGDVIVLPLEAELDDPDGDLPVPDFSALLKSGEIENYLWQELAKLVSDQASSDAETQLPETQLHRSVTHSSVVVPDAVPPSAPTAPALNDELELACAVYSSSPSPIVYPLRTQKKCKSLAAIDLPSFPRLS